MSDTELLAEKARHAPVVVVGGGIAGLVAALRCAELGMPVTVLEAAARPGGAIRRAEVAGLTLDVGAESYATRGGHVRALAEELGLGGSIVRPKGARAWLAGLPGAAPLPSGGLLGIPENPWAPDVRRIIGWRGAWRAYLDRLRPPLTIGHQHNLGTLVRTRMGDRVLDRLVAPVVTGVYSARPEDIDVDAAVPGLNAALTRVGSLSGAVAVVRGDRDPKAAPGAAVEGIEGGVARIVDALLLRLSEFGAEVLTETVASSLLPDGEEWLVRAETRRSVAEAEEEASEPEQIELRARAVIVATDEGTARALLAPVVPDLQSAPEAPHPVVDVVTLVVDAPALDAHPRGSGVLTVPGSHRAKALTHSTAKWGFLADQAAAISPHRHVVRVSFGAQGEAPATEGLEPEEVFALARAEASALLGVELDSRAVVGAHHERFAQSQPASAAGHAERARSARGAVRRVPGLAVTGAWLAGTGIAQVVPDAETESEHVRRHALWGPDAVV